MSNLTKWMPIKRTRLKPRAMLESLTFLAASAWIFLLGTGVVAVPMVIAQDYPVRPMRLVTGGVGGSNDFASRGIAQGLATSFGWQVIVDNRGAIASIEIAAKAPADGYTIIVAGSSFIVGSLMHNTPYDPVKNFSPITLALSSPNVLVVHPSVTANSVKELIAFAKANPGRLNYAATSIDGAPRLAAELFKSMAGIDIVGINYKDASAAIRDLIAGSTHLSFGTPASILVHVKAGRLKPLAVTTTKPSALVPDLPTVSASGLPGYESSIITSVFAPANTPAAVINKLNTAIVRVLSSQEIKERFLAAGVEVIASSPDELAAMTKLQLARLGNIIKSSSLQDKKQ